MILEVLLIYRVDNREKKKKKFDDPDVIRTRNLLIWSQTRYRCATESYLIHPPEPWLISVNTAHTFMFSNTRSSSLPQPSMPMD